ncbi:ParA family protein [Acinetobacter johnsonii]|uniref:ParA family protein n=1 Tax=Acinetobacter johnsonii TaxID=40214 RepID=UPI0030AB8D0D
MSLEVKKKATVSLAVANQKGGVGKTIIASHAAIYAEHNYKVVIVDLDPQANATSIFKERGYKVELTMDLFQKEIDFSGILNDPSNVVFSATPELLNKELLDLNLFAENIRNLKQSYDNLFIVYDTPPVAGDLQIISLVCSDFAVSPIELSKFSIDGLSKLINTIQNIKSQYNPDLEFVGIVANRVKKVSPLQNEVLASLKESYSHLLLNPEIPERQVIEEAITDGLAVWELSKSKLTGKQMKLLQTEIFNRIESIN